MNHYRWKEFPVTASNTGTTKVRYEELVPLPLCPRFHYPCLGDLVRAPFSIDRERLDSVILAGGRIRSPE